MKRDARITPWEVTGEINYEKLVKEFGVSKINAELLYNHRANIITKYCKTSEFSDEMWAKDFGCK